MIEMASLPNIFYNNAENIELNEYKMTILPLNESYPDDFVQFCDEHFKYLYLIRDKGGDSKYKEGQWVLYQFDGKRKGVYEPIDILWLRNHAKKWLKANNQTPKIKPAKECIARLAENRYLSIDEFDERDIEDPIMNCNSGLLHVKSIEIEPHDPEYKSLLKYDLNFKYTLEELEFIKENDENRMSILLVIETFYLKCWMNMRKKYRTQMFIFESYLQAIFRRDVWIKLMLFIIGCPNSGKSTIGQLLFHMMKPVLTTQSIDGVGTEQNKWGLSNCIGKRVVYDSDSVTTFIQAKSVKVWKRIVGDPDIPFPTPIIYHGEKDVLFDLFVVVLSNQLPKLPPGEMNGFLKRAYVIVMDIMFNDDPNFEQDILKEKDWLFTYLILRPYSRFVRKNIKKHVKTMKNLWEIWSQPLLMCFKEHYERSVDPSHLILVTTVRETVYNQMDEWGYELPRSHDKRLTDLLKKLSITKVKRNVNGIKGEKIEFYLGIKKVKTQFPQPILKKAQKTLQNFEKSKKEPEQKIDPKKVKIVKHKMIEFETFTFEDIQEPLSGNVSEKEFIEIWKRFNLEEFEPGHFRFPKKDA